MAMQKDRTRFNVRGGGNLQLRQLVSGSVSTTWSSMGHMMSDKLNDAPSMQDFVNDAGDMLSVLVGAFKITWEGVLMQVGIDEINFIRNTGGLFFEMYYSVVLANGNTQEFNGIVMLEPKVVLNFASNAKRDIPVMMTFIKAKAAYTRTPTDYNNPNIDYYLVLENAVAKGLPTDQVGTVYTATI